MSSFCIKTLKYQKPWETKVWNYDHQPLWEWEHNSAPPPLLKFEKKRFFTRNTPKFYVPPSARRILFKCAPPNLKSWIRPCNMLSLIFIVVAHRNNSPRICKLLGHIRLISSQAIQHCSYFLILRALLRSSKYQIYSLGFPDRSSNTINDQLHANRASHHV